jgi:hypothetical protein
MPATTYTVVGNRSKDSFPDVLESVARRLLLSGRSAHGPVNERYGEVAPRAPDDGLVILAIASSNAQLPAATPSSFKLFGVRSPPSGISVATSTAFLWFAGS